MTALLQKAYVPEIELTAGQPAPIAANGGFPICPLIKMGTPALVVRSAMR